MSEKNVSVFRAMHHRPDNCLVLDNVWDAAGAAILEVSGAEAIATSSASVSWSLGYSDGNHLPVELHLSVVERICRAVQVPVTIDIEEGYSDEPEEVVGLVKQLVSLGVAGINIEDGANAPELLIEKLVAIRQALPVESLFINARCDVFLRQLYAPDKAEAATIERLERYVEAGTDSVFVPGLEDVDVIARIADVVQAPLNIMSAASAGQLRELHKVGVARVSRGPNTFLKAYEQLLVTGTDTLNFTDVDSLFA